MKEAPSVRTRVNDTFRRSVVPRFRFEISFHATSLHVYLCKYLSCLYAVRYNTDDEAKTDIPRHTQLGRQQSPTGSAIEAGLVLAKRGATLTPD